MPPKNPSRVGRGGAQAIAVRSTQSSNRSPGMSDKSKGGQENTNTDLERQLISAIHKQIGCERTGDDNITLLTDINKEIQKSIKTLCEKSGHDIEASQIPPKGTDKKKQGQASATPMTCDLRTAVDSTESIMKANKNLLTYRKELKEISDQVKNMVELQGFQPDIRNSDKDTPGAEVKETLVHIQQRNRELGQQLKLLDKAIKACKIEMELQHDKSAAAKPKTEIRKKINKDESDLSTIERAVKGVNELQGYKSKMDSLALRVIFLSNQKKNKKQDTVSLSHFEQAIIDMEDLNKTQQKTPGSERQTEQQIKELSRQLKLLDQAIMPSDMESEQHKDKAATGKLAKDQGKAPSKESKTAKENKTTFDLESDIAITSKAVKRFKELYEYKKNLIYNSSQVSHFVKGLEEFMTENTNLRTPSPVSNKTQKKLKNPKDHENSKTKENQTTTMDSENSEDAAVKDFPKHMSFLIKAFNQMKDEISQYKTSLTHAWNTTYSAANHVRQVTEKTLNLKAQFKVENEGIHKSEDVYRCDEEVTYLVNRALNYIEEVQKLRREVELVQKENDSLQQRLSKIAGDKLTEGNPDITNLGDPNRPMKIGEWFSELYDNEWTDVMDLCLKKLGKKFDEDTVLQALYKTLMTCYMICKDNSTKSIAKARKHFQDASKELMIDTQEDEIIKLVIDNRKSAADSASKQLLKEIQDGNYPDAKKFFKDIDEKILSVIQPTPYFSQCMTLCWKMVVQNPPLVLLGGPPQGKEFDRNKFREYTSSGTKVIFTVWPALYLHENGPLLVKGVVKVK